jgi:Cdc6-like AAA superfamily ATPase
VIQLQQFPNPPSRYRAQQNEPTFDPSESVRLITGHSGTGKTSWAGEFGLHRGADAIYFDCSDLPSSAIAASLVRELAARYLREPEERRSVLLPGAQGLQELRLIDEFLSRQNLSPCLVLDNVQRIAAHDANEIVASLPVSRLFASPDGAIQPFEFQQTRA